ncbi:MAG: ABC transporter substrate-binding protein [Thermovirgaceae bacterium]|jgi:branched-chain amino acid transport system substrate-binding protein|nr:ABC transporter substrate-binding protein [Synergistales bacterium]MDI9392230.1 ABC transporter substrate-binding protein [Synergistota bacterium]MDY0179398.1 ABC transporter substrate-binding protein [Synergistaceae bacterium]HRW87781.1 ABC transporter substrate-binding protein [Thermovirgaceae bacterium]MDD3134366.1 ABC transporter substrate-binding protein [Synergistales bacterium]
MKRLVSLVLALALIIGSVGVVSAADTIRIGLMAPLTGFAAADGLSVLQSVQLAVDQVNAKGGVLGKQVELFYVDDAANAKEAVGLARKLVQMDKVVAVVGGSYSMPTRAVAPLFQEFEIPLVAGYAVHPDITVAGDFCFRNGFLGTVEGRGAGVAAVDMLKAKTVGMLTMDNDFGRTMAEGFEQYVVSKGAKVVYSQVYPLGEKDFMPYLTAIKEADPDVVLASGYYAEAAGIVKQAYELKLRTQILGEEGYDSPKFVELAGEEAANGTIIVTNLDRDDERPVVQAFIKEYRERYGMEPDMVGASNYDAFMIITDAIERAGTTDAHKVKDAIAALKDFDGVTGVIKGFTEIGEVIKPVQVQIVKDGVFRRFGIVDAPEVIDPRK